MIAYLSSRAGRVIGLTAAAALGLGALTACGGGTVSTVTVTDTATATVTVSAAASTPASTPATTRPAASTAAGTTAAGSSAAASSAPATSAAPEASRPSAGPAVPTSVSQETILTVRLEAFDPATGTVTFVPQDVVETEGDTSAVLSDPVGATPVTAQVSTRTDVKFLRYGTDIGAAIAANDVYCTMVLDGSQVSYLWELHAT